MKKIANAQGLCDFLFSGRPQAGYYLGFRESGHARRDTVEQGGEELLGELPASASCNAYAIGAPRRALDRK